MNLRVVCLGNSHTAGFPHFDPAFGGNPHSSYQFWFNQRVEKKYPLLSLELINAGVCGDTTIQMLIRFRKMVKNPKECFDTLIIMGGTNDVYSNVPLERSIQSLLEIIRLAKELKISVLLCSPPPLGSYYSSSEVLINLDEFIHELSLLSIKEETLFADIYSLLLNESGQFLHQDYNSGDDVHLSIKGYRETGIFLCDEYFSKIKKKL